MFRKISTKSHGLYHHKGIGYVRSMVQQKYVAFRLRSTLRSIHYTSVISRKRSAMALQLVMLSLISEYFDHENTLQ